MPNEVTPTQADRACATEVLELHWTHTLNGSRLEVAAKLAAAHRIAHEAPLLARNAGLLRMLADAADALDGGNLDSQICCSGHECGCQGSTVGQLTAHYIRATLATKDTPSHD